MNKQKPHKLGYSNFGPLAKDDNSVHVRILYVSPHTSQVVPIVDLQYMHSAGGVEAPIATPLLLRSELNEANQIWKESFSVRRTIEGPGFELIQSHEIPQRKLYTKGQTLVYDENSFKPTAKYIASEMQNVLNYAAFLGLLEPGDNTKTVFITIENLRTSMFGPKDGEATLMRFRVDPRGLALGRNSVLAHEFAHILQYLSGSGGITARSGQNLMEGSADLFATGYDVWKQMPEMPGLHVVDLYRRWGFDTNPIIAEYNRTGTVSLSTLDSVSVAATGILDNDPKMYNYVFGAVLVMRRLLMNQFHVPNTLKEAFRSVEVADFVAPINEAHSRILSGELVGVLRA